MAFSPQDQQQLAGWQGQVLALKARDPQGWLAHRRGGGIVDESYLAQHGISMPGYVVAQDGTIHPRDSVASFFKNAALMGGGMYLGGTLLGGLGGGGSSAAAGTSAAGTGSEIGTAIPSVTGEAALPTAIASPGVTAGTTAASSAPSWLPGAIKVGGSLAGGVLARHAAGGSNPYGTSTGLPPALNDTLNQLLQQQLTRQQSTNPVHDAAMQLAMKMSGGVAAAAGSRLAPAIAQAQQPRPGPTIDPAVLAAIQHLMGGGGQ